MCACFLQNGKQKTKEIKVRGKQQATSLFDLIFKQSKNQFDYPCIEKKSSSISFKFKFLTCASVLRRHYINRLDKIKINLQIKLIHIAQHEFPLDHLIKNKRNQNKNRIERGRSFEKRSIFNRCRSDYCSVD